MHNQKLKEQLLEYSNKLNAAGWSIATSGNISVRGEGDVIILTPSGVPYEELRIEDLFEIHPDGTMVQGRGVPSSSRRFHEALLRNRKDANVVLHTHAPYCITASIITQKVPAVTLNSRLLVGPGIPVSPYAENGSQQEAQNILSAIGTEYRGVLMQNHGAIALGVDLHTTWITMAYLEECCRVWVDALSTGREPSFIE